MAAPAPTDFKQYQDRKNMSEDNSAVEEYKRNCEYHRLLRKYCGPNAYSVFMALVDRANDKEHDGWAFPSYELLMEDTGMGNRNAITTALEILFDLGLIEWELNGRHAIYKPAKKVNSTELILFNRRAEQYQSDTKDSIKTVRSIVSKRYSNVYQSNVNQKNELIPTPNGVGAAPPVSKTIDFPDYKPTEPEPPEQLPEAQTSRQEASQPGPATDKDRAEVGDSSLHIPAPHQPDLAQEVKGFEAGDRGRDMAHGKKARDKPKVKGKEPDPNSSHPAVEIWREIYERFPDKRQMAAIVAKIGNDPLSLCEWRKHLDFYSLHSRWDQTNLPNIFDSFDNKRYLKNGNGTGNDRGRSMGGPGSARPVAAFASSNGWGGGKSGEELQREWDNHKL